MRTLATCVRHLVALALCLFGAASVLMANDTLGPNQQLGPNEVLQSHDGRYRLTNQDDGTLVYAVEGWVLWSKGPYGGSGVLTMQGDGNLVFTVNGGVPWATHTEDTNNVDAYLLVQDDGNLVLYRPDGSAIASVTNTDGAQPPDSWLGPNGWLGPGEELVADNGRYRLRNQPDGQLALYVDGWYQLWSSGGGAAGWAVMQDDGNFVLYRDDGTTWSTGTQSNDGAHLQLQGNGELVIYAPPWAGGGPLWATPTANGAPPTPTLTIDGLGEGAQVTLRTKQTLAVHVSGVPGTSFDMVRLFTYPGNQLLDARSLVGLHDTTVSFDSPPLPDSGQVIAYYYGEVFDGDGNPVVLATSPMVTILPVALEVNGQACCQTVWVSDTDQIFVRVRNYSGQSTDWVGLYRVGAPYNQPAAQQYLDGSSTVPPGSTTEDGQLLFDTRLEQNAFYEARLYQAGATTPVAVFTQIYVRLVPPTLTFNGVGPNGQIDVAEGQALLALVGSAPPSSSVDLFSAQLQFDGAACQTGAQAVWPIGSGMTQLPFNAPVSPEAYRVYVCRLLEDGTWEERGSSARIVVHAPVLTVNGAGAGEIVRSRPNALLTAAVQWAPDLTDIVEIRTLTGRPESAGGIQGDQQIATVSFGTPNPQLSTTIYEARLLRTDGTLRTQGPQIDPWTHYKVYLRTATVPEDTGVDITVSAGDIMQAAVGVDGHVPGDWLGLFPVNASDGAWVLKEPLPDTTTETLFNAGTIPVYRVTFVVPPGGPYEVRFISSTSVRLGVSGAITVIGGEQPQRTLTLTPTKARPGDPLTFTVTGPIFGIGDRIEFVRVADSQIIEGPAVSGPSSYPSTAPSVKGQYHTRWVSGDGQSQVGGPDLNLGLRGADTFTYYDTDAIGSVRLVTDAAGAAVERHDYLPFGTEWPIPSSSGVVEHKVKFAGKERDAESGLDYFGARYYGSLTGRFAAVDPVVDQQQALVDPQRWNRYAYVTNRPLRFTDPDGRIPIDEIADAAFIVSDLVQIAKEGATTTNVLALGADVVGAAVPFLTGLGEAVRAARAAESVGAHAAQAAAKSAVGIGEHAGESIAARSAARDFTTAERAHVNRIGSETGCHSCGTKSPGTKSGNFVPDHQPPSALNPGGGPQRLYPQCIDCSRQQGLEIARRLLKEKETP